MNKEITFVRQIPPFPPEDYPSSVEENPSSFEKIPQKSKRPQRRNHKYPPKLWSGDGLDSINHGDHRRGGKKSRW